MIDAGSFLLGAAAAYAVPTVWLLAGRFDEKLVEHREQCDRCQCRAAARRARRFGNRSPDGRAANSPSGSVTAPVGACNTAAAPTGARSPADAAAAGAPRAVSVEVATPAPVVATRGGRRRDGHPMGRAVEEGWSDNPASSSSAPPTDVEWSVVAAVRDPAAAAGLEP